MEGVLVSGDVEVPLVGQCARCLEDIEDTLTLPVQELFAYSGSTTEATSEEDEVRLVEGEHLDLEPMVRDAVVLALPLSPTCTDDCSGLCVDCGERLDDLPDDHSHDVVDPRWAGLAGKLTPPPGAPGGTRDRQPEGELTWPSRSGRCPAATPARAARSGRRPPPPCRRARTGPAAS